MLPRLDEELRALIEEFIAWSAPFFPTHASCPHCATVHAITSETATIDSPDQSCDYVISFTCRACSTPVYVTHHIQDELDDLGTLV